MRATHATRRHCLESMKKSTKRRDVLADCCVPVFTSGQHLVFKMGWRWTKGRLSTIYKDYNPEDVVVNFDAVDGVGFMKSMVNFFEQNRITNNGTDDDSMFGWTFSASGGKRRYVKFKWEGDELVTGASHTESSHTEKRET